MPDEPIAVEPIDEDTRLVSHNGAVLAAFLFGTIMPDDMRKLALAKPDFLSVFDVGPNPVDSKNAFTDLVAKWETGLTDADRVVIRRFADLFRSFELAASDAGFWGKNCRLTPHLIQSLASIDFRLTDPLEP